jgi:hypothetical protein
VAKIFIPVIRVVDSISKPPTIYCDNKTTVFISSGAAKHIDIRYLVVRERVHDLTINLEHIGTEEMLVDLLTKDLPPNIFEGQVADMGLLESLCVTPHVSKPHDYVNHMFMRL